MKLHVTFDALETGDARSTHEAALPPVEYSPGGAHVTRGEVLHWFFGGGAWRLYSNTHNNMARMDTRA